MMFKELRQLLCIEFEILGKSTISRASTLHHRTLRVRVPALPKQGSQTDTTTLTPHSGRNKARAMYPRPASGSLRTTVPSISTPSHYTCTSTLHQATPGWLPRAPLRCAGGK
eukprot:TRINITY_DN15496_c0_g2_i1.p1 TRINITY_DN15496_c0_g2~~TRINITY_DN15496_c0_g2_i1.p1  ORF type:complete len:112 (+),score=3.59 TRINITY_DN15496_c0_g2_i1:205-540(+)